MKLPGRLNEEGPISEHEFHALHEDGSGIYRYYYDEAGAWIPEHWTNDTVKLAMEKLATFLPFGVTRTSSRSSATSRRTSEVERRDAE